MLVARNAHPQVYRYRLRLRAFSNKDGDPMALSKPVFPGAK